MAFEKLIVTAENTTLDLLLWRRFRREFRGLVEDTLGRNPGIAGRNPVLPVGAEVLVAVPDPSAIAAQAAEELVVDLYE